MQHTGKEVYTTIGGYDTSLGDFRLGEEYYEEGVLANYAQIPDMLEQLCKETNEKLGNVHDILTVKLAADFHYRFMHIKPFGAGNITVGLLMMNYIPVSYTHLFPDCKPTNNSLNDFSLFSSIEIVSPPSKISIENHFSFIGKLDVLSE